MHFTKGYLIVLKAFCVYSVLISLDSHAPFQCRISSFYIKDILFTLCYYPSYALRGHMLGYRLD